jgi:tetratricopeptide (TPR) repeat protein
MLGQFEEGNVIFESAMLHHDLFPQAMFSESKFRMLLTKVKAELDFDRNEEATATGQRLIRVATELDEAGTRIRWAYPLEMIYGFINEGHIEEAATLSNELMIFLEELLAEDPDASMSIRVSLGKKLMDAKALDSATSILEGGLNLVDIDDTDPMIAGRILMFAGLAAARSDRTEEATAFFEQGLGKLMGEPSANSQRIALIEAMARGEHAEARRLLAVARDAIDGAAQKAVYEGLIAEFPLQE